ncbi:DNA internalization-related competence protein ComEC/Rec2 [Virgibacillus sp. L01]|uniref:DNA internalization-related competence protein ComEC/Rec2 n=1 Tax=Virgibacillus sp. L01 TaxID=3457429 RepID=UPI003FD0B90B
MKGYWYVPALGVVSSALSIIYHSNWFIVIFFIWLLVLFFANRLGKLITLTSIALSIIFFFYIPDLETILQEEVTSSPETDLSGQIASPINESSSKIDFIIKEYTSNKKILIVYYKNEQDINHNLKFGATCNIKGTPELPSQSRNPGQFDYQHFLLSQGITHEVVVNSLESLDCSGSSTLNKIHAIRTSLINYTADKLSHQTSIWLNALVLGDDSQLSEETVELFQRWNLSHLLAISGLHVGLIVGLLYFLLIKLNILTREKAQWVIIFFLPLYALVAGGEPSVWRASSMVLLFLLINKVQYKFSVTDVLSIVFILLILLDRYIIYSIGFQLSFCVTMGLLLSKRWLAQTNVSIFSILKISFLSQMVILPLQLLYFSTFQPLSILLNVMVVPYFSLFVIPFMFLLLLMSPFAGALLPYLEILFNRIHDHFISFICLIDQFAYYPWVIGSFSLGDTIVYYSVLLIFLKNLELAKLKQAFLYGCILTLVVMAIALKPYFSPVGSVTMLDIGQGDAMVVELPYRKGVILIDAGARMSFEDGQSTPGVYKQIIKPYLFSRGIREVDALFISHEDSDHMGSLPFMLDNVDVKKIIVSEYYEFDEQLTHLLVKANAQVERVEIDNEIVIEEQAFHVVSPNKDRQNTNENSLVLYTTLGGKSWLFTGDIGRETEKEMIALYPNLKVDVLKVAHHGSNSSTGQEFLKQIKPAFALLSVGLNNSYGHPHNEVITTLEEQNVALFRTDKHGAIQYYFKDDDGTFFTIFP